MKRRVSLLFSVRHQKTENEERKYDYYSEENRR